VPFETLFFLAFLFSPFSPCGLVSCCLSHFASFFVDEWVSKFALRQCQMNSKLIPQDQFEKQGTESDRLLFYKASPSLPGYDALTCWRP